MPHEPLNRLEERSKALNAESDTVTKTLKAIEDRLNKLSLGVEAEQDGWGFGKIEQKRWGFYKVHEGKRKQIIQCSRSERVEFAQFVGRLIDELSKNADEERARLESANATLADQLRRLEE